MSRQRKYAYTQIRDNIALVTIDRPPVNAWNLDVQEEVEELFEELFEELSTMDEVGVVIVKGGGNKAFVAGADIKMILGMSPKEAYICRGLRKKF